MGLISGANVIIANTQGNRNSVVINAGIVAYLEKHSITSIEELVGTLDIDEKDDLQLSG